ncbi:MAG: DUF5615 family PIN-like protein [Acidimicrobiales bacterium]
MRLLFDQNLSRNLVGQLRDAFPESQHVTALGLDTATDREIWEFARENGYLVVSKDSDFRQLAFLYGPPPKVVWLRVGNASPRRSSRASSNTRRPSWRSRSARTRRSLSFRPC